MHTAHPHVPANAIASLWDKHHTDNLNRAHLRFSDISQVVEQLAQHDAITSSVVGHACSGTPITRLTVGSGPLILLAWTQMHGDEPTATAAVLEAVRAAGISIRDVKTEEADLEDVFLALTKSR